MALDLLLQEASGLSEAELNQVIRFVRFIKIESVNKKSSENENVNTHSSVIRKAGIYRGKGWMSDDFNEPLDDFKEYME